MAGRGLYGSAVSVVVPTRNCRDSISDLIDSLRKNKPLIREVLIVDSSTDETGNIASRSGVRVMVSTSPGLNKARNMGVKNSLGEIVCFTDGDCIVEPDWITRIVSAFEANSQIACVGGSVRIDGGSFLGQYAAETLVSMYPRFDRRQLITPRETLTQPFGDLRLPVGCNMAFRKKALEDVGLFDGGWKCGWDEFECMHRLLRKGYSILVDPQIVVHHHPRQSFRAILRQAHWYGGGAGVFMRRFAAANLKDRVYRTLLGALRTIPHSLGLFRKKKRLSILLYPVLDFAVGIAYYLGLVRLIVEDQAAS